MSNAHGFPKKQTIYDLPMTAKVKLKRLKERDDDLWSLVRGLTDSEQDARADIRAIESEKRRIMDAERDWRLSGDVKERAAEHDVEIAKADEVLRDIAARRRVKNDERGKLSRLIRNLEDWLDANPRQAAAKTTPAPVPSIGTRADAARFVREKIEQFDGKAQTVSTAPLTVANAKKVARAEIEALAEAGRPDCAPLVRGQSIMWPRNTATQINSSGTPIVVDDARAVLAWLHKDAMIAAVEAEVEAAAKVDGRKGYTDEKRAAELERIAAEKLAAEREEEALIAAIEAEGGRFDRRPDADPRAVLGVQ